MAFRQSPIEGATGLPAENPLGRFPSGAFQTFRRRADCETTDGSPAAPIRKLDMRRSRARSTPLLIQARDARSNQAARDCAASADSGPPQIVPAPDVPRATRTSDSR